MDEIAYDSDGNPYIVNNDKMDRKGVRNIIRSMKSRGFTDIQIKKELSKIEKMVMDITIDIKIAQAHLKSHVKKSEKTNSSVLSEEDKQEIMLMTQMTVMPTGVLDRSAQAIDEYSPPEKIEDALGDERFGMSLRVIDDYAQGKVEDSLKDATIGTLLANYGAPTNRDWGRV